MEKREKATQRIIPGIFLSIRVVIWCPEARDTTQYKNFPLPRYIGRTGEEGKLLLLGAVGFVRNNYRLFRWTIVMSILLIKTSSRAISGTLSSDFTFYHWEACPARSRRLRTVFFFRVPGQLVWQKCPRRSHPILALVTGNSAFSAWCIRRMFHPHPLFLPATQGTFTFARGGGGWRLLEPLFPPFSFLSFSSIFPCSVRSRRKIEKCSFGILRPKNVEMYFSGDAHVFGGWEIVLVVQLDSCSCRRIV